MKVGIINLSQFVDFGLNSEFSAAVQLLAENGVDAVDYACGRDEPKSMVAGLHAAIDDPEVGIILAHTGGTTAIQCIDLIDWGRVESSGKLFVGLSDFTHFAWKAVEAGATCVYGLALWDFVAYRRTSQERQPAIDFLRSRVVAQVAPYLLRGTDIVEDWGTARIIGGHTFISMLMMAETKLDLSDRVLMLEHHYNSCENRDNIRYWAAALARVAARKKPRAVLLGHSTLMDGTGQMAPAELVNDIFIAEFENLNVPLYYVDHFKELIVFRP